MKQLLDQIKNEYGFNEKYHCRDLRDKNLILKLIEIIEEQSEALENFKDPEMYVSEEGDPLTGYFPPCGDSPMKIAEDTLTSTEAKLKALAEG